MAIPSHLLYSYILVYFYSVGADICQPGERRAPGLIGYALANRADAVQLWEPAYSILMAQKPSMRALDPGMANLWKKASGTDSIPYLGVAAHEDRIKKNPELVDKLYATFKEAGDWMTANPAESAKNPGMHRRRCMPGT